MTGVPSPLDALELLTAQDGVRRLARSLVFDQQRVDDLVQEAWVAAMQRPPRQRAAVAGWFRATLHNLARRRSRDEARRRAREVAAARPEALPSASDVLAREQQRREVVEAVLSLPEPYRGTVLARFFDELEPAEIARRRAVPAATVRSQLHRALEMLRQRFDERHGSRQAWGLWLLPLAKPARTTGIGMASVAGALLMAKVLVGGGVLALLVLGFLWSGGGGSAPAPTTVGARETGAVAAGAAAPVGTAASTTAAAGDRLEVLPRAPARSAAGAAGLRGRVVHPDGTPAADRLVRVLGIDGVALFAAAPATGACRTLSLPCGAARTGDDGAFVVAGLAPHARYVVNADADGPDRTLRLCGVTPFPDQIADLGDVVLEPKASIAGRAVDDGGAPVAGAEVLAFDLPAALAAVLPFDRFVPANGGMLSVPVPDAGHAGDAAGHRERLHDFFARELFDRADLDRRPGLATLVVDRLPWLETMWQELPVARATTAADGSFLVRAVEPGANLLIVRKTGLGSGSKARVAVQAGERRDVGEVVLPAGEELRGVVHDAAGHGVAGAEVRVGSVGALGYRGVAFGEAPVMTDREGAFRVPGLGRGRVMVAARRSARDAWCVLGPQAVGDDVDVVLAGCSLLELRVGRDDAAEVHGVAVELFAGPDLHELRRAGLQQQLPVPSPLPADDRGVRSLGELPDGCYTLHVEAEGAMPVETMVVLPQQEPLAILLPAAMAVRVRVHDDAGKPIAGATIYVVRDDASAEHVLPVSYGLPRWDWLPLLAGTTDAAGELQVALPAAGGALKVMHPRYAPGQAAVAPAAATADVALGRPGAIEGRLFDHGVPADSRRFCVVAATDTTTGVPLPDLCAGLRPDGSFAFPGVVPAQYRVHAAPVPAAALSMHQLVQAVEDLVMPTFFGEDPISHRVTVAAGATATLQFDVDPNQPQPGEQPARLQGRALLDGVPQAGAELQRRLDLFRFAAVATVGADGSFAVAALPPGEQHLRLCRNGESLWEGELTLAGGELRSLDLVMATGSLRGTATFATGLSPSGHVATARGNCNGGVVERYAALDAAGGFAFAALPAGDYEVAVSGPEGKCAPVRVSIVAGAAAAPLRLQLQEVTVLSGRIVGDLEVRRGLLFLRGGDCWHGAGLGDGGSFHFSDLKPEVYTLELQLDGKTIALEPGRFDMSHGSQRDLQVRALPAAERGK